MLTCKNQVLVRRLKSEINQSFNFVPHVQGGGGVVSVWRCMSRGARGPLMIQNCKLNGPTSINIIKEALSMFIQNTFDPNNTDWVYMHDNAPQYSTADTKKLD